MVEGVYVWRRTVQRRTATSGRTEKWASKAHRLVKRNPRASPECRIMGMNVCLRIYSME